MAARTKCLAGALECLPPRLWIDDGLGDVRRHGGEVGPERRQCRRVTADPADPIAARLGLGHVEGSPGGIHADDLDPAIGQQERQHACTAADVQHVTGAELRCEVQVCLQVAAVGIERVVERGQLWVSEGFVRHASERSRRQQPPR